MGHVCASPHPNLTAAAVCTVIRHKSQSKRWGGGGGLGRVGWRESEERDCWPQGQWRPWHSEAHCSLLNAPRSLLFLFLLFFFFFRSKTQTRCCSLSLRLLLLAVVVVAGLCWVLYWSSGYTLKAVSNILSETMVVSTADVGRCHYSCFHFPQNLRFCSKCATIIITALLTSHCVCCGLLWCCKWSRRVVGTFVLLVRSCYIT